MAPISIYSFLRLTALRSEIALEHVCHTCVSLSQRRCMDKSSGIQDYFVHVSTSRAACAFPTVRRESQESQPLSSVNRPTPARLLLLHQAAHSTKLAASVAQLEHALKAERQKLQVFRITVAHTKFLSPFKASSLRTILSRGHTQSVTRHSFAAALIERIYTMT